MSISISYSVFTLQRVREGNGGRKKNEREWRDVEGKNKGERINGSRAEKLDIDQITINSSQSVKRDNINSLFLFSPP